MRITLVRGDITEQRVDSIVNAANSSLLGGGGVDGAIHRRGGSTILEECRALRSSRYGKGLPTGQAVATTAGALPARWVIHTVGPVYAADSDRSELLASCYRESLRVSDELGARSVAFPAVSTGRYGWPLDDAARVAIQTVHSAPTAVDEVRFVLFDEDALRAFEDVLQTVGPTDDEIAADLAAQPADRWRELFALADTLTIADRKITWDSGDESQSVPLPYPYYSEPINRILSLLPVAVFDWHEWRSGNPLFPEGHGLADAHVADAVRLATTYLRAERFAAGAIGKAIQNGALTAIIDRLRHWSSTHR